jgi:oligopeptide/dipeptide ABC transporter ATP-binding protein
MPLLDVQSLNTAFRTDEGVVRPSIDVSFSIEPGETVGVVGESGSGKSVTAKALLRLVRPARAVESGRVLLDGRDILAMSEAEVAALRGREIAMIFQDPMSSLNPLLSIGEQISRVWLRHRRGLDAGGKVDASAAREAREAALAILRAVRIPDPEERSSQYPHQLSGGMRQRVMIAMALVARPRLVIADEPTTALDVTVEAQVIELLADLKRQFGMAVLFISHNLPLIAEIADRIIVMYAGRIVESGPADAVFGAPQHPYTRALLRSIPAGTKTSSALDPIRGEPPVLTELPPGCPFQARCDHAAPGCEGEQALRPIGPDHSVGCHRAPIADMARRPAPLLEEPA